MNIEDDPKLTAYILNELDCDEESVIKKQLSESEGSNALIREAKEYASMIREAYDMDPAHRMTSQQREGILKDSEIVAVTGTSPDKMLSFRDGLKSLDKEKTEAERINVWKKSFPMLVSFSAAALVIGMAVVLLKHEQIGAGSKSKIAQKPLDPFSVTVLDSDTTDEQGRDKLSWVQRQMGVGPVKFPITYRYGQPKPLNEISEGLVFLDGESFRNPAMEGQRWSVFPSNVSSKSYDLLREFMLAGDVPDGKNVHIGSLINAFEYDYEYPNSGEKFAINAEVANCPWDQERWLIHIGVRAADINKNKEKDILLVREVRMAVEFNPDRVAGYRLIGEDDTKKFDANNSPNQIVLDGQAITALYEIVPMEGTDFSESLTRNADSELVSVRIDYTDPENKDSRSLISSISHKSAVAWEEASEDMRFATSVAGYGLLLGGYGKGSLATYDLVLQLAKDALGEDKNGQRSEFIDWIKKTKNLEERR
ncbi:MAG TPA: DUF3520 domain-containing protein [Verrucomicrobia bacterium]|nr:DUF3520 domain-containing protein [Verrucomicrobiales bacterium]HIL56147.1 DUF3520 domain-containing protein [Verrucomicrobiota bacterium]